MKKTSILLSFLLLGLILAPPTRASVVLSPIDVVSNSAGNFDDTLNAVENTIDQSGLSIPFESGNTDWNAYFARAPQHSQVADNNEWYAPWGINNSAIIYDLGGTYLIDQIALWNEDWAGISNFSVWFDNDSDMANGAVSGGTFNPVAPPSVDYPAELFALGGSYEAAYVHFYGTSNAPVISMGEIAFSASPVPTPAPSAFLLFFSGVIGIASCRRFRPKAISASQIGNRRRAKWAGLPPIPAYRY